MNNGKSNTKGPDIRRLIATLLLVVFCVAVFASSAAATQYDPNHGPFPEQIQTVNTPSGDDGGWTQPNQSRPHGFDLTIWRFLRWVWTSYGDIFIEVGDQAEDSQGENESTDDDDTTANRSYGSF